MTTRYPKKDAPVLMEYASGSGNASAQSNVENKRRRSQRAVENLEILDQISTQPETETVIEATKH